MDPRNTTTWACLNLASDIIKMIDKLDTQVDPSAREELAELKSTVATARTKLTPFLAVVASEVAFDLCLQQLRQTLQTIIDLWSAVKSEGAAPQASNSVDTTTWNRQRLELYRMDFMLKLQVNQFVSMFRVNNAKTMTTGASLISDPEARELWIKSCGETTLLVPWATFFHILASHLRQDLQHEEARLRPFIDFTCDGFVTPFEFHTFLQWFGPLRNCCKRLLAALDAGLLAGFAPAIEADQVLHNQPVGAYVIRFSKSHTGSFAVMFVDGATGTRHCLLHSVSPAGLSLKNPPTVYPSLKKFVEAHSSKLKQPLSARCGSLQWTLSRRPAVPPQPASPVLARDFPAAAAAEMPLADPAAAVPRCILSKADEPTENSDVCAVCLDKKIETVFLECGHMACCKSCSGQLTLCPLCRGKITRVVQFFKA